MTATHIKAPGKLTDVYTTEAIGLGSQYIEETSVGSKRWVFCKNSGGTSWTSGVPVGVFLTMSKIGEASFTAATQLLVDDGTTEVTAVAGIAPAATVATGEYGWLQVGGIVENLVTNGTVEASSGGYVADNGVAVIIATEPTAHGIIGVGITADVGNVSSNFLLRPGGCHFDF
jgi:hypothetical protein